MDSIRRRTGTWPVELEGGCNIENTHFHSPVAGRDRILDSKNDDEIALCSRESHWHRIDQNASESRRRRAS